MKDLPHHLKKLNRRVIRSFHREEMEEGAELPEIPPFTQTQKQLKKKAKLKMTQTRQARTAEKMSPEKRNQKMKKRVPIFDRTNNAKPKRGRSSSKKTPRI